jgi:peptide/nickel transport system permease protein
MIRRIPTVWLILALSLLILLTILRWDLIGHSTVLLIFGIVRLIFHPGWVLGAGSGVLLEFAVAAFSWWFGTGFLVLATARRMYPGARFTRSHTPPQAGNSGWLIFLYILTFASLTTPFLCPVPPNSQGDLATTRLLPPLAHGVLYEYSEPSVSSNLGGIEGEFANAALWLSSRRRAATGTNEMIVGGDQPSQSANESFIFLLGTDDGGRDVLSRVIAGTRVSLGIGVLAAMMSLVIGSLVGFAAGLGARAVDFVLMRLTDLALAIPGLFLAIGLMAFLGQSLSTLVLVLALTGWMSVARVVRGEVLVLREKEYVLAARLLGVPGWRIALRHMLPNLAAVVVSAGVLQFANVVLAEAALGFLGLGIQPPTASWGNMMGEALGTLQTGWWVGAFPGVFLAGVLVAAHELAEGNDSRSSGYVSNDHDQSSIQDHP